MDTNGFTIGGGARSDEGARNWPDMDLDEVFGVAESGEIKAGDVGLGRSYEDGKALRDVRGETEGGPGATRLDDKWDCGDGILLAGPLGKSGSTVWRGSSVKEVESKLGLENAETA